MPVKRALTTAAAIAVLLAGAAQLTGVRAGAAHLGSSAQHAVFGGLGNGRIFQSTDGGHTWQESDSGLAGGPVYPLIAGAGLTVYSAPGDNGVYISSDGGKTWQDDNGVNGPSGAPIYGLAVDPGDGRRVYALDNSNILYRSSDSGGHWSRSDAPLNNFNGSTADAIQVDPLRPSTMLITSHDGMDISTDSGLTWQPATGITAGIDVFAATFSGANPDVAYAASADGVYQTIDGGASWQLLQHGIPGGTTVVVVAIDPLTPSHVVAYSKDGAIFRTTDGGTTWKQVGDTGGLQAESITFDPIHPGTVIAGTNEGSVLLISNDGGATWGRMDTPFGSADVVSLAAAVRAPLPTDAVAPPIPGAPGVYYASASHHIIRGGFLSFYNSRGGLRIFGLPLTEAFTEHGTSVQFFERAELVRRNSHVEVAPLGTLLTTGRDFAPASPVSNTTTRRYFPATHHILADKFLRFWQTHSGSLVFGMPISESVREQNGDGTGRVYLVQYFQNGRLEYHPELSGSNYEISVGQVGRQALQQRGWL